MQEGCDTVEMLQDLEEQDMLGWNFKKLHVKTILRKAQPSASGRHSSGHGASSRESTEGTWNKSRYKTLGKLGEGGFGCTWLVSDSEQGNKQLALKEIRCDDLNLANQAIEEFSMTMNLQHPQLVSS